jgi:cephalosporin-C deacetylase
VNNFAPEIPEDFDAFWQEAFDRANVSPLDYARQKQSQVSLETHDIELISFRSIEGSRVNGWLALPKKRLGKARCFVWVPPYGRESNLPNNYTTREGFVSLSFNFFGHDAFHQETYQTHRGYFADGILDPNTCVFKRMAQDVFIAVRVLRSQLEADEDRLAVCGMSQGAGMAIWAGAHSPHVKLVCADMPFLCGMQETFSKPIYRYPLKEVTDFAETVPLGMERVLYTLAYFDTVNQSTRVKVPTLVSYGLKDPACKPANVKAAYDAIPSKKTLVEYQGGHDWDPGMVNINFDFMMENLS